jgi:hypothetical protein
MQWLQLSKTFRGAEGLMQLYAAAEGDAHGVIYACTVIDGWQLPFSQLFDAQSPIGSQTDVLAKLVTSADYQWMKRYAHNHRGQLDEYATEGVLQAMHTAMSFKEAADGVVGILAYCVGRSLDDDEYRVRGA